MLYYYYYYFHAIIYNKGILVQNKDQFHVKMFIWISCMHHLTKIWPMISCFTTECKVAIAFQNWKGDDIYLQSSILRPRRNQKKLANRYPFEPDNTRDQLNINQSPSQSQLDQAPSDLLILAVRQEERNKDELVHQQESLEPDTHNPRSNSLRTRKLTHNHDS